MVAGMLGVGHSVPKLPLSVLDLSPIPSGTTAAGALRNSIDLARFVDQIGYERYWLAEHHNSTGIASSSPEIMIATIAAATERLRVGSGGVMLPNHSSLKVAETFRTLHALHPGRIDLGIGRAPGTDPRTAAALRRNYEMLNNDDFPNQLTELLQYFDERPVKTDFDGTVKRHGIIATPSGVEAPELWMLGSSGVGMDIAAQIGVGAAFAHHFAPGGAATDVLRSYREKFTPSQYRSTPYAIVATSVVCAETTKKAEILASSVDLAWLRIFQGKHGPFPSPLEARSYQYLPEEERQRQANRERHTVGDPGTVKEKLLQLVADTQADELMILTMVHDHEARRRSYQLLAEVMADAEVPVTTPASA